MVLWCPIHKIDTILVDDGKGGRIRECPKCKQPNPNEVDDEKRYEVLKDHIDEAGLEFTFDSMQLPVDSKMRITGTDKGTYIEGPVIIGENCDILNTIVIEGTVIPPNTTLRFDKVTVIDHEFIRKSGDDKE